METYIQEILGEVDAEFSYARGVRRTLHQYPEIARQEYKTAQYIEQELKQFGLETKRVDETGVYAQIVGTAPEKTSGKPSGEKEHCILLRADIDALPVEEVHECDYKSTVPGVMHACGHDAHTAALLTAAKLLSKHKDAFRGCVRLVFQQGEEIGYGARQFLKAGCAEGADRCFGVHVASNVPVGQVVSMAGPNNASVDWFRIHVSGKAAHVSTPELGVDALLIASQIVTGVQSLVTRLFNPMDPLLIGIGKLEAGSAYNVVAEEAVIEGTIRAMTLETREKAKKELEKLAELTAQTYGGSVTFEWEDFTSPLINDTKVSKEVAEVAAAVLGKENVITSRTPALGGDDFAEFIRKVPGAYAYVGSANALIPETTVSHHNGQFDIDENCLVVAAKLYVAYALSYLQV